ncbi:MAG: hypothetical protein V7K32_27270 [Nostoc sp.]
MTNKKYPTIYCGVGRKARPITKGGQDFGAIAQSKAAHPTRLDNLFLASP